MFRGRLFSNTVTVVMLFFSDVIQYIPVKLCKTSGSIHLFKIFGQLTPDQITLERKLLWDVVKIEGKEVFMTLNGTIVHLLKLVIIPLRDKFRLRHIKKKVIINTYLAKTGNIMVCFGQQGMFASTTLFR